MKIFKKILKAFHIQVGPKEVPPEQMLKLKKRYEELAKRNPVKNQKP